MIPVLIDTREQRPFTFDSTKFKVERATIKTGDYSIRGLDDHEFVLERKSLGDFVGTVIGQWIRFRHELNRLSAFDYAAIVVEADVADVMAKRYESEANPLSVIGRAHECFIDHRVPVFFYGKSCCNMMVERLMMQMAKKLGAS